MFRNGQSHVSYVPHQGTTADARWTVITAGADPTGCEFACRDIPGGPLLSHKLLNGHAATLQRLSAMISPHRMIAVVDSNTSSAWSETIYRGGGQILVQPAPRGTAAPVLLAVSYVLEYDPKATLLVMPSDQVAHPEERFQGYLLRLCLLSELFHDQIVVLGAGPLGPENEFGWLMPGGIKSPSLWAGAGPNPLGMITYYDRPNGADALRLFQEGGLINTGVYAVKVKTLWKVAWEIAPQIMRHFDAFRQVLHSIKTDQAPPAHEEHALTHLYQSIEPLDLSMDLLQRASDNLTVLPMDDVSWSDRRSPERMREVLARAGSAAAAAAQHKRIELPPHEFQWR